MAQVTGQQWDEFIAHHTGAHILQTSNWGKLKSAFGWRAVYVVHNDTGAMILLRKLAPGISLAYIPKGPIGHDPAQIQPDLDSICQQEHVVFLKVEPDTWENDESQPGLPSQSIPAATIQPRRTIVVSLEGDENSWLARMKQKTRYNIRLAEKKGVVVNASQDWAAFEKLLQATGKRDGFGVHDVAYYRTAYEIFHPAGLCELFMAYHEQDPLAAVMVFAMGTRAWYFYGASGDEGRNLMPAYLIQWEAMRWAAQKNCSTYDLWGIPDESDEVLESGFESRSDGLWGVYRFKRGFGGTSYRASPAVDIIYQPLIYKIYRMLRGGRVAGG